MRVEEMIVSLQENGFVGLDDKEASNLSLDLDIIVKKVETDVKQLQTELDELNEFIDSTDNRDAFTYFQQCNLPAQEEKGQ